MRDWSEEENEMLLEETDWRQEWDKRSTRQLNNNAQVALVGYYQPSVETRYS